MALIGGALLLGLFPERNSGINGIGVATIVVAVIILIYEILMIIFALIDHVNHSARLLVVSGYHNIINFNLVHAVLAIIILYKDQEPV